MRDAVEKEIWIESSPQRVWQVLTEAHLLEQWLGPVASIDLRPGGTLVFPAGEDCGTKPFEAELEIVDPPRRLAFRWRESGWVQGGSTRVELTLEPSGDGTHVRLVESGFASLDVSDEVRELYWKDIDGGWQQMLERLVAPATGARGTMRR